ncbi:hypothetical protein Q5H93_22590 [Hymenobacter sp. ASUV-10]|uniref:DUF4386 family protein n=1 Tax=Hymenobacter aranciens TaxID=3063996 RepID=A0ABT9BH02_9BACT|nr:hypothetical protein [Hymenobacter sp. ASUV-10]MDO7877544.1 hypothetical protein [Hymenobacter sp. ASUV-10]
MGSAQAPLAPAFDTERRALDYRATNVLGTWALANVAAGTALTLAGEGQTKAFGQMTLGWGAVNLGIVAAIRLGKGRSAPTDRAGTVRAQLATENIYLLNAGLDVAYLAGGFWLLEHANTRRTPADYQQNKGFGEALLVQGGFLLLFDGLLYRAHHRHGNKGLYPLLSRVQTVPGGVAVVW